MVRCEQRVQQSSLTGPAPALPMHPGLQTGRHTTICGHFTSPDRQAASNGLYLYSCGYRTGPRHNFTSHLCGVDSSHLPTHHSTGCDHGAEVCADDTKHMHIFWRGESGAQPHTHSPRRNAPTWDGVAAPAMMSVRAASVSSAVTLPPVAKAATHRLTPLMTTLPSCRDATVSDTCSGQQFLNTFDTSPLRQMQLNTGCLGSLVTVSLDEPKGHTITQLDPRHYHHHRSTGEGFECRL
jgi:hypothetical protein